MPGGHAVDMLSSLLLLARHCRHETVLSGLQQVQLYTVTVSLFNMNSVTLTH